MRIDLTTPYQERHKAKALGARWDAFKRCWYIVDPPDSKPFQRWLPLAPEERAIRKEQRRAAYNARARTTGPDFVVSCGCNVLPWEDCSHSRAKAGEPIIEMPIASFT